MNIFYDNIVYWLQRAGGISTYWYELTNRLLNSSEVDLRVIEMSGAHNNIQRKLLEIKADRIITEGSRKSVLMERFRRVKLEAKQSPAIFHSSYFRLPKKNSGIKKVCTVHDFTHDLFFKGPRVWLHNYSKRRAIYESDAIITVSENTKRDLFRFYPDLDSSKVFTIYNGVSEEFKFLNLNSRTDERPYIIYIGARDNYKNFNFAVDLLSGLKEFELKIIGSTLSEKEQAMVNRKLGNNYTVHTGISISELNYLYNKAYCLLYPSSYEGFGIPLVEAMKAGCPFIALNNSSIPEVAGKAGLLLEEANYDEGIEAIRAVEKYREKLKQEGLRQANHFSWDTCYDQTMNLYKQLL